MLLGMLNQWEKKRERQRLVDEERERLEAYQFCNRCGIPLGQDEKIPIGSGTVCCFDCAREVIAERRHPECQSVVGR